MEWLRVQPVNAGTPQFRDIAIDGVTIDGARQLVVIDGLPESPIEGLRLTDVTGSGNAGLVASYAANLQLSGVELNVQHGAPFRFSRTTDLVLDRVTSGKFRPACS